MVFQVGAFSDAAVFGRACPILIRFDFTWVIFSPRDPYHTGSFITGHSSCWSCCQATTFKFPTQKRKTQVLRIRILE